MKLQLVASIDLNKRLLNSVLTYENLKGNLSKFRYYTGLPDFVYFEVLADEFVEPYMEYHKNTRLNKKDQLLLTLVKLRLNLPFRDLAYRFGGIHPTTCSTYFKHIISVMSNRMRGLVYWPERELIKKTIPQCFREAFHDKTTVIIDCFEIKTQKPSSLLTAAQSWSNYKHYQTVKYLIGILPQGSVCYISEGWGGRVSDKVLTENSAFINHLQPGDVIMADRGFLIKEFVNVFGVSVNMPAFTRGKSQLHPIDLEKTRNIASCRIHVERIIGLLRQKFFILNNVLPISMLNTVTDKPIIDDIVLVCCALINLFPGVIPL